MDITAMRRISREMKNQFWDAYEEEAHIRAIVTAQRAHQAILDSVTEMGYDDDQLSDSPDDAADLREQARESLVPDAEVHAAAIDRALREVDAFRARLVTLREQTRASVDAAILAWEAER